MHGMFHGCRYMKDELHPSEPQLRNILNTSAVDADKNDWTAWPKLWRNLREVSGTEKTIPLDHHRYRQIRDSGCSEYRINGKKYTITMFTIKQKLPLFESWNP